MGRNMFGGHPGPWHARTWWNGWWGVHPPFHHPVFVLTHHPREQDVSLAGGASAAQQYLAAGLVDEMEINVVPTLLGSVSGFSMASRRSARARARADGRRTEGNAPLVRQALGGQC